MNNKKGFTLIELIVALTIFIIVIVVVTSLFVTGLKGQRKVIALQNLQDNARYLLEFMAKEIRMSDINSSTAIGLNITRPDGENVEYSFTGGTITRTDSSISGPINSEEVSVTGSFYTMGLGPGDGQQPRVTIVMQVDTLNIQTTICPRNLEL